MPVYLGLDIGSNSVGSAWVNTDEQQIRLAVSVFPAGVNERKDKRGAPKNQARRQARAQRRMIRRRAQRKRELVRFLMNQGLLPQDPSELRKQFEQNPWQLRRDALSRPLTPHEFGRVLVHMAQRRGALGVLSDPDNNEGKVKEGMDPLNGLLEDGQTVGQLMAKLIEQRREAIERVPDEACSRRTRQRRRQRGVRPSDLVQVVPIRNRQYRLPAKDMLFAGRELIQQEFGAIWEKQKSFDSDLAKLLTDGLKRELDDPERAALGDWEANPDKSAQYKRVWRHGGRLFGQRRAYWNTGTLGRCALEPTDRCVPVADRHASYFRVVETVNNIRITLPGQVKRCLQPEERQRLIQYLRGLPVLPLNPLKLPLKLKAKRAPKNIQPKHLQEILGIDPKVLAKYGYPAGYCQLQFAEADPLRNVNTDWFYREVVLGAFGEGRWNALKAGGEESNTPKDNDRQEAVNRAILKYDPEEVGDAQKLRHRARNQWGLDEAGAERLIEAWKNRPPLRRLNLSRRAIRNLLPHMETFDSEKQRWPTQQEARKAHAKIVERELVTRFVHEGLPPEAAIEKARKRPEFRRYATGAPALTAADRHYMKQQKHHLKDQNGAVIRDAQGNPIPALPPAPMISNPVVRRAIHEVRRHLLAWVRKFRRKPDRVVIEFARGVRESAKRCNEQLAESRLRDKERRLIEKDLRAWGIPQSNWDRAVLRVRLCREQNGICPFSLDGPNANRIIDPRMAAAGSEVEIEHIIPEGLTGRTMAFNNLVLCFRHANRGKGMRTPADWLGSEKLQAMLRRLENAPIRNNRAKWARLQAVTPDEDAFRNSQLTDTAYAARQVAAYIADALYDGHGLPERGGEQRIFTTKGEYTSRLRADWGLHESTLDRAHGLEPALSPEESVSDPHLEQSTRRARKAPKDRSDHRHHALDAVVTALLTPELLRVVTRQARKDREYYERTGYRARRKALPHPAPWPTPESFHAAVTRAFEQVVVSHRPVKRRLTGALHEEDLYGTVTGPLPRHRTEDAHRLFSIRMPVYKSQDKRLKPGHLRVPAGWDDLSVELDDPAVPLLRKRAVRRELLGLEDPPPKKSGIVRDRTVRDRIRKCLRASGIDPDNFSKAELQKVAAEGMLTMPSGVPIKSVVLLRTNTDPVVIPRRTLDHATGQMLPDMDPVVSSKPHPRTRRVYIGGNNHHLEIRATGSGEWIGKVVSTFQVYRTLRRRLRALHKLTRAYQHLRLRLPKTLGAGLSTEARAELRSKTARANLARWKNEMRKVKPQRARIMRDYPLVDRSDSEEGRFVMSLAVGEMVYARRRDRPDEAPTYYVVCKLDRAPKREPKIHFAPHWDARTAPPSNATKRTSKHQDRWDVTPGDLKNCGPQPGEPPVKVHISPLGEVKVLERD